MDGMEWLYDVLDGLYSLLLTALIAWAVTVAVMILIGNDPP